MKFDTDILSEFFKYDKNLPLEPAEHPHGDWPEQPSDSASDTFRQYHIVFSSVRDQRVPALLTLPSDTEPPFPVVLILHGAFGNKSSFNQVKRSDCLATAGYATFRIDGQYRGEREVSFAGGVGLHTQYYYRNRDAMIQTAIDLMRAVDYLETRDDIDMSRLGFAGFSMGGMVGTLFCSNDPRVKAVALGITGGDFRKFRRDSRAAQDSEESEKAFRIVDPVLYVSRISPRPLLMINGVRDEVIPRAATEALFDAARDPKRIIWLDCGHADLPDHYLDEIRTFFDTELNHQPA